MVSGEVVFLKTAVTVETALGGKASVRIIEVVRDLRVRGREGGREGLEGGREGGREGEGD